MASSSLKAKRSSIAPDKRGKVQFDRQNAHVAPRRYKPVRTLSQFDFGTPADRAQDHRRAFGVLGLVAVVAAGGFVALTYFAGMIAAVAVAAAVAALAGLGNWTLNHSIEL